MRRDGHWRFPLLLLVMGAHAWLGWKLAHYHPAQLKDLPRARRETPQDELLMLLDFSRSPPVPVASKRRPPAAVGRTRRRATGDSTPAAIDGGPAAVRASGPATLDLSLRPAGSTTSFRAPDPLEHRSALEYRSTRWAHAWLSEGDLEHVAARKSKVAAVLLGALGALREPCTERQRRDYDPDCVPDQYHHEGALDALPAAR